MNFIFVAEFESGFNEFCDTAEYEILAINPPELSVDLLFVYCQELRKKDAGKNKENGGEFHLPKLKNLKKKADYFSKSAHICKINLEQMKKM